MWEPGLDEIRYKNKNGRFLMWEPAIILLQTIILAIVLRKEGYIFSMKNSMAFFMGSRSSLTVVNTK